MSAPDCVTCPRCRQPRLQDNLAPPFGSWCPCGFTVPEVSSSEEFAGYIAAEQARQTETPPGVFLTPDDLWTDVDLQMAHWALEALLNGSRTLAEARRHERRAGASVRASFENAADRRSA